MIAAILVSSFVVCAIPPPVAMVQGPYHEPAYVALFNHLKEQDWRSVIIRGPRQGRIIFVGFDREIEEVFKRADWRILVAPYKAASATMVMVLPPMRGNERGMNRMIQSFSNWLMPGGYFVIQPFVFEEDANDIYAENARSFLMDALHLRIGGIKIGDKYFDVYQKNRRSA